MDLEIAAAARALAAGDPIAALNGVALREDAPALALRAIALAQLGDLDRARTLVRNAARAFGARASVARSRCIVAEAELALALRDLTWRSAELDAARATLERHGDRANAVHARQIEARRALLIGRLDDAERALTGIDPAELPAAARAVHFLVVGGVAMRRLHAQAARTALARAAEAARETRIAALEAEVETALHVLDAPAAKLSTRGEARLVTLDEAEALLKSSALVIDACRHRVCDAADIVPLATRPVLLALARTLGEAWPGDAPREKLIADAFRMRVADESQRMRLRVEIGRLRAALRSIADVRATRHGFALATRRAQEVVVLARPVEHAHATLLAFLADGEPWSSSALALALGASQRTVQRALEGLAAAGRIEAFGRARARRWMAAPMPGFATPLLLPVPLTTELEGL